MLYLSGLSEAEGCRRRQLGGFVLPLGTLFWPFEGSLEDVQRLFLGGDLLRSSRPTCH